MRAKGRVKVEESSYHNYVMYATWGKLSPRLWLPTLCHSRKFKCSVAVVSLTAFCGQIRPRPTGGFRQRRIWVSKAVYTCRGREQTMLVTRSGVAEQVVAEQ